MPFDYQLMIFSPGRNLGCYTYKNVYILWFLVYNYLSTNKLMIMKTITDNQIARLESDWIAIAGEPVDVQLIGGKLYGFCSELGARRIAYKYRSWDVGMSLAKKSWYFGLELN